MSDLPRFIDPFKLVRAGHSLRGEVQFAEMPRLVSSLIQADGAAKVSLDFNLDEQGVRRIRGSLRAQVVMQCQRCMEPVRVLLSVDVKLGIVTAEPEMERLPPEYEPLLVEAEHIRVAELVEDELILALPVIARHAEGECGVAPHEESPVQSVEREEKPNPFAVLAQLK